MLTVVCCRCQALYFSRLQDRINLLLTFNAVLLFISNYIGDRIIGSVSCIMQLFWLSDARFAVLLDKEGGFTTFVD